MVILFKDIGIKFEEAFPSKTIISDQHQRCGKTMLALGSPVKLKLTRRKPLKVSSPLARAGSFPQEFLV